MVLLDFMNFLKETRILRYKNCSVVSTLMLSPTCTTVLPIAVSALCRWRVWIVKYQKSGISEISVVVTNIQIISNQRLDLKIDNLRKIVLSGFVA